MLVWLEDDVLDSLAMMQNLERLIWTVRAYTTSLMPAGQVYLVDAVREYRVITPPTVSRDIGPLDKPVRPQSSLPHGKPRRSASHDAGRNVPRRPPGRH